MGSREVVVIEVEAAIAIVIDDRGDLLKLLPTLEGGPREECLAPFDQSDPLIGRGRDWYGVHT